jgi:deoxyribodipyrimidine photolyase-related protein
MILGSFMLLCEFSPDAVYQWFMELFIDAYDWVMVPNVYGMSQYADGGLITTKPYICWFSLRAENEQFQEGTVVSRSGMRCTGDLSAGTARCSQPIPECR